MKGSGWQVIAMTEANIKKTEKLYLSQENKTGTHKSQHQVVQLQCVSRRSVQCMQKKCHLKLFKWIKTSTLGGKRGKVQSQCRHFRNDNVKHSVFTDEKDFTLEVPTNRQNNGSLQENKKTRHFAR